MFSYQNGSQHSIHQNGEISIHEWQSNRIEIRNRPDDGQAIRKKAADNRIKFYQWHSVIRNGKRNHSEYVS